MEGYTSAIRKTYLAVSKNIIPEEFNRQDAVFLSSCCIAKRSRFEVKPDGRNAVGRPLGDISN